ncbi:MAG: UvrD-helicase domain-containing protein [Bacteroidaceae bacterium]|nr:UvrD-helicase domain-containing protein [Bacteroidaceae bacterium]
MKSRFLLFKASAGSGKTYNLAIQYIALLVARGEQEFRHTLAVTFTNKATAEMKDRILEFLYDMWKGRPKSQEKIAETRKVLGELYELELSDEEIRERCHRALHAILHDYSRFTVCTIDAFFQSVLRSMAHELKLSARLQVDLDDKAIIELAVESLIENLRQNNRDVLPWLRQYIEQQLEEGRPWDVRRELKEVAQMIFKEEYLKRALDKRNQTFDIQHITAFKKTLQEEKHRLLAPLKEEAKRFEEIMQKTGMDYEELFSYQGDVDRFITQMKDGNTEANFGKRLSDMADDPLKLLKAPLRKRTDLRPTAQLLAEQLKRIGEMFTQAIPRIGTLNLALTNLTPMGLLGAIDNEVSRLSAERSRFMLARTPIMLRSMVQGEDASFVFERTGTQFHNIMIDEFQDTSLMQWENFRTLLLDNLASGGLSLVVGDIKQSIYRWRNGDWRILYGLDHEGYRGTPLTSKPLDENYRSQGRIVRFNNSFFPLAAEVLDKMESGDSQVLQYIYNKEEVEQKITTDPEAGMVRIRLCKPKGKETEEAWPQMMLDDVALQIEQLHEAGVPYREMAILLRHNRHIRPLITYFAQKLPHIRLVSGEAFLLGASVAVKMVVEALQVVDDPNRDPVALFDLVQLYHREVLGETAEIPPSKPVDYLAMLPEEFRNRLTALRHLPLYELCERLYQLLQLEKIADRQDAYLFTFFDELSAYLRDNPSDIPTFLQYWEDRLQTIPIPGSEVDGICIYTIHKSKGLAFHTVLMPFAEWDIEKDRTQSTHWCLPSEPPFNEMGTLPIHFSAKKIQGTLFEDDYKAEHANRRADELNALYVAFTRAKGNLLVWGMSQHDMGDGKWDKTVADLMYDILKERPESRQEGESEEQWLCTFGTAPDIPVTQDKKETMETEVTMQSYEGGFSFRQSGQAEEFIRAAGEQTPTDEQQLGYLEQGKLLHYIFSQIETADDIERVTERFARQGVLKSRKQVEQVRALAHNGLRHERVGDWFSGRYRLFNECNILIPDPDHAGKLLKRRPDRVMLSDDHIIVVDFKFGKADEAYKTQVREYIHILQSMYPSHTVEGWLWYVYKNKTEQV